MRNRNAVLPSLEEQARSYKPALDAIRGFWRDRSDDDLLWCVIAGLRLALRWVQREPISTSELSRPRLVLEEGVGLILSQVRPAWPAGSKLYLAGDVLFSIDTVNQWRAVSPLVERLAGGEPPVRRSARPSLRRVGTLSRHSAGLGVDFARHLSRSGVKLPVSHHALQRAFLATARAMARSERVLDHAPPRCIVVATPTGIMQRALLHCGRQRGIPSVYIPHAPVIREADCADLPVDYAGLRGWREIDHYGHWGVPGELLDVVGNPAVAADEAPSPSTGIPVLAVSPMRESMLREVIELVHRAWPDRLILAPHPRSDLSVLRSVCPPQWEINSGRTYDLLRRGASCLVQLSSGVAWEAMSLGIPTVELHVTGKPSNYPFLEEPYCRTATTVDELRAAIAHAQQDSQSPVARESLRRWASEWCSPVGEESVSLMLELIERAKIEGPRSVLWDSWRQAG